jgi:hypothetical protein
MMKLQWLINEFKREREFNLARSALFFFVFFSIKLKLSLQYAIPTELDQYRNNPNNHTSANTVSTKLVTLSFANNKK